MAINRRLTYSISVTVGSSCWVDERVEFVKESSSSSSSSIDSYRSGKRFLSLAKILADGVVATAAFASKFPFNVSALGFESNSVGGSTCLETFGDRLIVTESSSTLVLNEDVSLWTRNSIDNLLIYESPKYSLEFHFFFTVVIIVELSQTIYLSSEWSGKGYFT